MLLRACAEPFDVITFSRADSILETSIGLVGRLADRPFRLDQLRSFRPHNFAFNGSILVPTIVIRIINTE